MSMIIVPSKEELIKDGFFCGQVIVPKKDHVTRWSVGQIIGMYRFDLPIGPILKIRDLAYPANLSEELPAYVDFLVRVNAGSDTRMSIHQLIFHQQRISRIVGFLDNQNDVFQKIFVKDIDEERSSYATLSIGRVDHLVVREESDFVLQ